MARLKSARTLAVIGCAGAVACTKDVRVLSGPKAAPGGPRIAAMLAVRADAAWAAGFLGSPNVSVFILDSGIDYLHFDLLNLVDRSRSVDLLGTFSVGGTPFTERDTVAKYFGPAREAFSDLLFHG